MSNTTDKHWAEGYLNKKTNLNLSVEEWDFHFYYLDYLEYDKLGQILFVIPTSHLKAILSSIKKLRVDEQYIDIFCDLWSKGVFSHHIEQLKNWDSGKALFSVLNVFSTNQEDIAEQIDPTLEKPLKFWLDLEGELDIIGYELTQWYNNICEEMLIKKGK